MWTSISINTDQGVFTDTLVIGSFPGQSIENISPGSWVTLSTDASFTKRSSEGGGLDFGVGRLVVRLDFANSSSVSPQSERVRLNPRSRKNNTEW